MISRKKKLSRKKGIYGYGKKKYNSRLKTNNMKKKSIKIMKGGSVAVAVPVAVHLPVPHVPVHVPPVRPEGRYVPPHEKRDKSLNTINFGDYKLVDGNKIDTEVKIDIFSKYYKDKLMTMKDFERMIKEEKIKFLLTTYYYELIKKHYINYKKTLVFTIPNRESKPQPQESIKTNPFASFRSKQYTSLNPKEIEINIGVSNGEGVVIKNYSTFKKYIIRKHNKEIVYYVFPNPDDSENPHIYWIVENTNQNITVEINTVTEHKVSITPLELSVDTMQLAINTNSLQIVEPTEEGQNTYLGFVNFPSLTIKQILHTNISSRVNAEWINVYEDESFIENDKYSSGFHINTLDQKEDGYLINEIKEFINLEYFIEMKAKIMAILDKFGSRNKTISNDDLNKELKYLYLRVVYGTKVKLEDNNKPHTIVEDISYVMKNALWLERYLEIKNDWLERYLEINNNSSQAGISEESRNSVVLNNEQYLADYNKLKDNKEYNCDLSGLDEKYIIIDDTIIIDGETYVICGYPDQKMKAHILNFWQNESMKVELDKVHQGQFDNNCHWFIDLFNQYKNKPKDTKETNEGDLYMSLRKGVFDYIEKRYAELYSTYNPENLEYKTYKEYFTYPADGKLNKFREDAKQYFQLIGKKYLPKPITQIKYVFLAFKKREKANKVSLEPFIFNVKELRKKHQPILKRIEQLIKTELPYRFGILLPDEKEKFPEFDDEYKLWYSRYRYGKFFHIKTEYVHTMSNIADKAHNYNNSITLEELIYACGLDYEPSESIPLKTNSVLNTFFKKLRIKYEIRDYNLETNTSKLSKSSNQKANTQSNCEITENRSEKVFCLYEEDKLLKEFNKEQILSRKTHTNSGANNSLLSNKKSIEENFNKWKKIKEKQNNETKPKKLSFNEIQLVKDHFANSENIKYIQFILVFKTNRQEYTFIYYYDGKFYKLVIESNISQILDSVVMELNKNIDRNEIKFDIINKYFKVVSINILDDKDYKKCFKVNPLIIKHVKSLDKISKTINIFEYIYTNLLKFKNVNMINLYNKEHTPLLVINFKIQIEKQKKNNTQKLLPNLLTYETDSNKFSACSIDLCDDPKINYIYFNESECGYDFIESIDDHDNKIIVYVISNNENSKTLGNFLDLDKTSLKMLKVLRNLYLSKKCMIFLHIAFNPKFYALHFHIVNKSYYKREYSFDESGSFLIQDMYIDEVINNLETNINYYSNPNLEFDIFKSY